jgi:ion channel-forming bestrophin family protein
MSNTFSQKYKLYTGKRLSWLQLTFLLGNSIFAEILPWVVFFASYSFVLLLIYYRWTIPVLIPENNQAVSTLLILFNLGLPSLLVFRTNTANERFWEARKLWGNLVNVVRNLTRDISIVLQAKHLKNKQEKQEILLLVVAFAIAMKLHLRAEKVNDELISLVSTNQFYQLKYNSDHPPLQIAFWIGDYLQFECDQNCMHIYQLVALHSLVDNLVDILGGCERILKTPQPIIYTLVLRKLVVFYCLLLPFEVIFYFRGFSIVIVTVVSIILFAIEQIGSQLEQPFGHHPHALPLDLICNTILQNVQELIKQTNYSSPGIKESAAKRHRKNKLIALKNSIVSLDNEHLNQSKEG